MSRSKGVSSVWQIILTQVYQPQDESGASILAVGLNFYVVHNIKQFCRFSFPIPNSIFQIVNKKTTKLSHYILSFSKLCRFPNICDKTLPGQSL